MTSERQDVIVRCAQRTEFFLHSANEAAQRGDFEHAALLSDLADHNAELAFMLVRAP